MIRNVSRTGQSTAAALIVFVISCIAPGASAWGNGGYSSDPFNPDYGMHDRIADLALSIELEDVEFLRTAYHTQFLLGTEAPDNPDYIGDSANHHVYFYSSGQVQDDKSAVRAMHVYEEALTRLNSGELSDASFLIGAMTHYVADVGVFGHTMGSATDWGAEVHHSDYESEFDDLMATYSVPAGIAPSPKSAYDSTMQLARTITFGEGVIKSNVWMDANYDWSDDATFVPSAMHSLDITILAVASVLDQLMIEASYTPPADDIPPTGDTTPVDTNPTPENDSPSNPIILVLSMTAVAAVSGILVVIVRRRQ